MQSRDWYKFLASCHSALLSVCEILMLLYYADNFYM